MEFILVILIASLIFAVCFAVLLIKGRKTDQPVRLHHCGQDDDCLCQGRIKASQSYDLKTILEKARDVER